MRFADHHDWRVTFFPPYALVVFTFMSIPPAIVAGWLIPPTVGWLLISTTTSMYLIYEFMHFCCHVDENWFVRLMRNMCNVAMRDFVVPPRSKTVLGGGCAMKRTSLPLRRREFLTQPQELEEITHRTLQHNNRHARSYCPSAQRYSI